jgi:hemerythrin-like domain-containing protein
MYRHVLVALGHSDYRGTLVTKAVDFARTIGARISFFSMPADTAAAAAPAGEAFVHRAGELAREMLGKAEAVARALGVPCSSTMDLAADPCQALARVAADRHCDILLLSSHGADIAHWNLPESAAMAGLPVLVFAADQPAPSTDQSRAIELLRAGRESVSMMLHLWLRLLDAAETRRLAADEERMKAIAAYLQSPGSGHHAVRHQPLFHCLRERTAVVNAELEELERQHALDARLLDTLNATLAAYVAGDASLRELKAVVSAYASFVWQHAGREEGVIIPTAQRYLREQDWSQIAAVAGQHGPEAGTSEDKAARLLTRIIETAVPLAR